MVTFGSGFLLLLLRMSHTHDELWVGGVPNWPLKMSFTHVALGLIGVPNFSL
jgi:hypothetical protein